MSMSRTVSLALVVMSWAAALAAAQAETADIRGTRAPLWTEQKQGPFDRARAVKTDLEVWSAKMRRSLDDVKRLESKLDLREVDASKIVLDSFRTILSDVRVEAEAILAAHDKFVTDFKLYREAVKQAPSAFEGVSQEFERKAREETDEFLKQEYGEFAKSAKALSKTYRGKLDELDQQAFAIGKMVIFVERSIRFVDDVRRFLDVIPATSEGAEVQKYVKRLNSYIRNFQETFRLLKTAADKMAEPEATPSPGARERKSPEVGRTETRPISLAEYRQALTALRR
jgi:hypothetical protein